MLLLLLLQQSGLFLFEMLVCSQTALEQTCREPMDQSDHVRELLAAQALLHVVQDRTKGDVQKLRLIPCTLLEFLTPAATHLFLILGSFFINNIMILLDFRDKFLHLRAEDSFWSELGQRCCISDEVIEKKALRRVVLLGADLLSLLSLLALSVVLGACLFSLLLVGK